MAERGKVGVLIIIGVVSSTNRRSEEGTAVESRSPHEAHVLQILPLLFRRKMQAKELLDSLFFSLREQNLIGVLLALNCDCGVLSNF